MTVVDGLMFWLLWIAAAAGIGLTLAAAEHLIRRIANHHIHQDSPEPERRPTCDQ